MELDNPIFFIIFSLKLLVKAVFNLIDKDVNVRAIKGCKGTLAYLEFEGPMVYPVIWALRAPSDQRVKRECLVILVWWVKKGTVERWVSKDSGTLFFWLLKWTSNFFDRFPIRIKILIFHFYWGFLNSVQKFSSLTYNKLNSLTFWGPPSVWIGQKSLILCLEVPKGI